MNGFLEGRAVNRIVRVLYWVIPAAILLYLYRYSLCAWFQRDDFYWLGLNRGVHGWPDFWRTMTQPMAQGTVRILSERALFMSFTKLFGLEIVPFRALVFLTAVGVLVLLSAMTRRVSGDRLAGFLAPLFWVVNSNLSVALSWTSAYNQLLCGFFLLLALHLRGRWADTGRRRYAVLEWVAFLAGFGALELNVMYPAIAAAYSLLAGPDGNRRRLALSTLPMFVVSLGYAVMHRAIAPPDPTGIYKLYWDGQMPSTLWTYWEMALGPARHTMMTDPQSRWLIPGATLLLTTGLVAFLVGAVLKRRYGPLMFAAWFFLVLAPLVPLREHITEYYLTIPTIGLAGWGACAAASALDGNRVQKGLAIILTLLYVGSSIPIARAGSRWWYDRGLRAKGLVMGVDSARRLHPDKAILLTGVDDELFWTAVYDLPFRAFEIADVYLAPGSESVVRRLPPNGFGDYVLSRAIAKRLLARRQAVVYDASGKPLTEITARYRDEVSAAWPEEIPRYVDVGRRWYEDLLGPTWYSDQGGYRWMPARATVRLGGPASARQRLYMTAHATAESLADGPLPITVKVDGHPAIEATIARPGRADFSGALPADLVGRESVEVEIQVGRTFRPPGDDRELGIAFGEVGIH